MSVDLHEWLDYCQRHPLLFRFKGLHSRGSSRKSAFHRTVGEAATSDERFMDDYMDKEYESHEEGINRAIAARQDIDGYLSDFCEYVDSRVSAKHWRDSQLPNVKSWDVAPLDSILQVVDLFMADKKDDFIRNWLIGDDLSPYYDIIQSKCQDEYLLKEHPPVAVWYHAGEYEIPLEDVFFVCPACHGEPHTEDNLVEIYGTYNGYPYFYCGSCGSEMNVGDSQDIRDFFIAMDISPYPFNPVKKAEWQKILEDRKAHRDDELELQEGSGSDSKVRTKPCRV